MLDTRVALTEISILKDVLTVGTARHVLSRLRRVAPGRRQDRYPAEQLDRRVRRGDALPVDGGAGARPGALHVDGQHPRVPRRGRRQRPGRHLPGPHLGRVHGAGARLRAGDRLAEAAAADPPARPACTCPASSVSSDPSRPRPRCRPTRRPTHRLPARRMRPAAMSPTRHHRRRCHPTPPTGTTIPGDPTATTVPPQPVYTAIDSGTTIPPDVLDPRAPLPSAPRSVYVAPCR